MPYVWQTIEEAAVTLGISTRTLHRRVAKGELETRLDDGRREVLVCLPDPDPVADSDGAANPPAPADVSATTVISASSDLAATTGDTTLAVYEDRLRRMDLALMAFQKSADSAADEVRRARQVSYVAWGTVGMLIAGIILSVTWAVHRDTWARADLKYLRQELQTVTDKSTQAAEQVAKLQQQMEAQRQQVEQAKVAAARAEGELSVIKASQTTPTTKPSILSRLVSSLSHD